MKFPKSPGRTQKPVTMPGLQWPNKFGRRPANDEMVEGYIDGLHLDMPEPSENRSASYRHGFANARDDRAGQPRASFQQLTEMADRAMDEDDRRKIQ